MSAGAANGSGVGWSQLAGAPALAAVSTPSVRAGNRSSVSGPDKLGHAPTAA